MHVGVNLYRYLCQLLVSCFLASITFTSNHIHILTVVIFTSMETSTPFASYKSMLSMLSIGSSVINFYPTASTYCMVSILYANMLQHCKVSILYVNILYVNMVLILHIMVPFANLVKFFRISKKNRNKSP